MAKVKRLNIQTTQGPAGEIVRESQFVFNYQTADPACAIALTMPLRAQSYAGHILPGVLRQNLPEGFLNDWIRSRFGKVTPMDDMAMLAMTGRDVIGRVRSLQKSDDGAQRPKGTHLQTLLTWKGTEDLFQLLTEQYAEISGVSGVQPKVVMPLSQDAPRDPVDKIALKEESVIVKSSGDAYPHLAENEYHCMTIARMAGLQVPDFWLSDDKKLFVVQRFDISPHQEGYLGFEDMTSLMNKQNDQKYDSSYEMVAKAVCLFVSDQNRADSLKRLFETIVLSVLLRNGDAHLKNFGLLYTDPTTHDVRLSPAYDIVTTSVYIPKDTLALRLGKTKAWPTLAQLVDFGQRHCLIDRPLEIVERISTAVMAYRPAESSSLWQQMRHEIEAAAF